MLRCNFGKYTSFLASLLSCQVEVCRDCSPFCPSLLPFNKCWEKSSPKAVKRVYKSCAGGFFVSIFFPISSLATLTRVIVLICFRSSPLTTMPFFRTNRSTTSKPVSRSQPTTYTYPPQDTYRSADRYKRAETPPRRPSNPRPQYPEPSRSTRQQQSRPRESAPQTPERSPNDSGYGSGSSPVTRRKSTSYRYSDPTRDGSPQLSRKRTENRDQATRSQQPVYGYKTAVPPHHFDHTDRPKTEKRSSQDRERDSHQTSRPVDRVPQERARRYDRGHGQSGDSESRQHKTKPKDEPIRQKPEDSAVPGYDRIHSWMQDIVSSEQGSEADAGRATVNNKTKSAKPKHSSLSTFPKPVQRWYHDRPLFAQPAISQPSMMFTVWHEWLQGSNLPKSIKRKAEGIFQSTVGNTLKSKTFQHLSVDEQKKRLMDLSEETNDRFEAEVTKESFGGDGQGYREWEIMKWLLFANAEDCPTC